MHILFEEDSTFKSGTLLSETDAAMQVEMPSGKRSKIKTANVLLRFANPSPTALLEQAQSEAAAIEADFLWECVNEGEFSFLDFARDYVGHEPTSVEATAVLLALQAAPILCVARPPVQRAFRPPLWRSPSAYEGWQAPVHRR